MSAQHTSSNTHTGAPVSWRQHGGWPEENLGFGAEETQLCDFREVGIVTSVSQGCCIREIICILPNTQ